METIAVLSAFLPECAVALEEREPRIFPFPVILPAATWAVCAVVSVSDCRFLFGGAVFGRRSPAGIPRETGRRAPMPCRESFRAEHVLHAAAVHGDFHLFAKNRQRERRSALRAPVLPPVEEDGAKRIFAVVGKRQKKLRFFRKNLLTNG